MVMCTKFGGSRPKGLGGAGLRPRLGPIGYVLKMPKMAISQKPLVGEQFRLQIWIRSGHFTVTGYIVRHFVTMIFLSLFFDSLMFWQKSQIPSYFMNQSR